MIRESQVTIIISTELQPKRCLWWCIIVQCIMCMCHENNYTIFGARHAQYDVSHNTQRLQWLFYSRWRMAVRRVLDWHNRRKRACCVCRRRAAAPPPALRLCQQHTVDIHTNGHRTVPRKKCTVLFATPSKLPVCLASTDTYMYKKPTAKKTEIKNNWCITGIYSTASIAYVQYLWLHYENSVEHCVISSIFAIKCRQNEWSPRYKSQYTTC